ncbi:hypothetical protein GCK72_004012 [Caenorhabditis remanei]|uniref:histone acetyltransferase n=1 Tax=Caenorhabditis remanei TaxID=31234 RepID=A0A6A5HB36_CAERE|nr:hypothetical protein GCK72_004012 [Caenorhabditis remanei]KAF1764066.1 hypothetical protein GCK72_004012 [Caenorhabditis remanei]
MALNGNNKRTCADMLCCDIDPSIPSTSQPKDKRKKGDSLLRIVTWNMFAEDVTSEKKIAQIKKMIGMMKAMGSEGFEKKVVCCTNQDTQFNVSNRYCLANGECRIPPGSKYMYKKGERDVANYCIPCYDTKFPVHGNKRDWKMAENINTASDVILKCSKCQEKWHKTCALFFNPDASKFVCMECGGGRSDLKTIIDTKEHAHAAAFMTEKLNELLRSRIGITVARKDKIRVCGLSEEKSIWTKALVPAIVEAEFKKKYSGKFKYVKRAFHVFQRIDGVDVILCSLYTQETPMGKRWMIDYFDSLPYFKVYDNLKSGEFHQEVFHAYIEYMSSINYLNGHIWSAPPKPGDDFCFNIHPSAMKYLDRNGLIAWYQRILKTGRNLGIIKEYRNFREELEHQGGSIEKPSDLPVFVDSLWCQVMKEVNFEHPNSPSEFMEALQKQYEIHATDNFVIELPGSKTPRERDTWYYSHPILGDRMGFLKKCVKENWEFSTLAIAMYASVALIQYLPRYE